MKEEKNTRHDGQPVEKDLIFGIRPVMEALEAGKEIERLLVQKGLSGDGSRELVQRSKELHLPMQFVPKDRLNRITMKNHKGVVAFVSPIRFQSLESLVPMIFEKGETPLLVLLDRVTDVRNMGAVIRTAVCAGAHAVVFPEKGAARVSNETVRTSAGAAFSIPLCRVGDLAHAVQFLKDSGLRIVCCTEKAETPIYDVKLTEPLALVMGSEEDGISRDILAKASATVRIPLVGPIASLNVSVSAGVILFEAVRQRRLAD